MISGNTGVPVIVKGVPFAGINIVFQGLKTGNDSYYRKNNFIETVLGAQAYLISCIASIFSIITLRSTPFI